MYKTISQCRICANEQLDTVLYLGIQALTGVFPRDRNTPVSVAPLELVKCRADDALAPTRQRSKITAANNPSRCLVQAHFRIRKCSCFGLLWPASVRVEAAGLKDCRW